MSHFYRLTEFLNTIFVALLPITVLLRSTFSEKLQEAMLLQRDRVTCLSVKILQILQTSHLKKITINK